MDRRCPQCVAEAGVRDWEMLLLHGKCMSRESYDALYDALYSCAAEDGGVLCDDHKEK